MSSYIKATDFAAKDALLTGNPAKLVKGTEIDAEFTAIQSAVNSKADALNATITNLTVTGTLNVTVNGGTY